MADRLTETSTKGLAGSGTRSDDQDGQLGGFPAQDEARRQIIEAALFASGRPLTLDQLQSLFDDQDPVSKTEIKGTLNDLQALNEQRGIELVKVAGGYRYQTKRGLHSWLSRLWDEKPKNYSRALLETLALIAYRQPITRGEIEDVRGVSVASNIIRTLLEREWIQVRGYRDVPGRPALFGTTSQFLDDFGLDTVEDLPPLSEIKSMAELEPELDLETGLTDDQGSSFSTMLSRLEQEDGDKDERLDAELHEHWESLDELNDQFEARLRTPAEPDAPAEQAVTEAEPEAGSVVSSQDDAAMTEAEKLAMIEQKLAAQAALLEQTESHDESKNDLPEHRQDSED